MVRSGSQAEEYIHSLKRFGKKAGLSNIRIILDRLGNPQNKLKFIHIAGTNGKGSVSVITKNILLNHSYKVGYYTSPYIEYFNERICINNECISDSELTEYTNRVMQATDGINPIEFEFITAMAFLYFSEKKCDVVVLEVGLGGRFDATNIIDTPLMNIITPIGLDHTSILGDTLEKIAFEKAGTIKHNSKVVISPSMDVKCTEVIKKQCAEMNAEIVSEYKSPTGIEMKKDYTSFSYKGSEYRLSLKGRYQIENALTAIEAALYLGQLLDINNDDIKAGLSNSFWKCRFEIIEKDGFTVVLDGAHNPHGVGALMESIRLYFPNRKKSFLFSMLNEKDWKKCENIIDGQCENIVVTSVPNIRQTDISEIFNGIKSKTINAELIEDNEKAFSKIAELSNGGGVAVVFGSLYLCGAIRKYVLNF